LRLRDGVVHGGLNGAHFEIQHVQVRRADLQRFPLGGGIAIPTDNGRDAARARTQRQVQAVVRAKPDFCNHDCRMGVERVPPRRVRRRDDRVTTGFAQQSHELHHNLCVLPYDENPVWRAHTLFCPGLRNSHAACAHSRHWAQAHRFRHEIRPISRISSIAR
jgi:hypothetical protein